MSESLRLSGIYWCLSAMDIMQEVKKCVFFPILLFLVGPNESRRDNEVRERVQTRGWRLWAGRAARQPSAAHALCCTGWNFDKHWWSPNKVVELLVLLIFNHHFLTKNNVRKTCMLIWTPKYLLDDTIFDAYCLTLSDRNNPGSTRVHRCRRHCPIHQESAETRWKLHWGFFQRGAHYFVAISLFWFEIFSFRFIRTEIDLCTS